MNSISTKALSYSYPEYKASGEDWLGDIPTHWKLKRLRFVLSVRPSSSETKRLSGDTVVSFLPMELIGEDGTFDRESSKAIADIGAGYTFFADGDVIVAKITPCFENGKGALMTGLINGFGFGTTELHVLRPGSQVNQKYLYYLTISQPFRAIGAAFMYGTGGQKRVPEEFIRELRLGIPPIEEQLSIVAFLDHEMSKIDALIAKREKLMQLLEEKRTALIHNAISKGVNKKCHSVETGVDWIGKMPAHWKVARIKHVARLESGHTPSRKHPEYWENCTIPWFGLADVWQIRDGRTNYVYETNEKISELGLENSAARLLPAGTVILSRTASVGFSTIIGTDMATTQDFVNWVCGPRIRPEYLLYVFRAMTGEFKRLVMGSTHQTIYMPDVERFVCPLPPVAEQDEIVEHIKRETIKIDALAEKMKRTIDLLKEKRSTLITMAVTGKIDVRSYQMRNGHEPLEV